MYLRIFSLANGPTIKLFPFNVTCFEVECSTTVSLRYFLYSSGLKHVPDKDTTSPSRNGYDLFFFNARKSVFIFISGNFRDSNNSTVFSASTFASCNFFSSFSNPSLSGSFVNPPTIDVIGCMLLPPIVRTNSLPTSFSFKPLFKSSRSFPFMSSADEYPR